MPTEKEKWEEKKAWVNLFDSITPEQLEQERREAKGLGPKLVATAKEGIFKITGLIVAPIGWALMWGLEKISDVFEPEWMALTEEQYKQLEETEGVPEELKAQLRYLRQGGTPLHAVASVFLILTGIIGGILGLLSPMRRVVEQQTNKLMRTTFLREDDAVKALFRKIQTEEQFRENMRKRGYHETEIDAFIKVSKFYPTPADLIRWQAREVFEPAMIERYGLDSEYGEIEKELFYMAGMTDEQILNYWRAHWEHASWIQVVEMLRRGLITEEEVWDWFRLVEIPPFWRDKLIGISWEVPTRVDIRRFWDMATIDEARLRDLYTKHGYHGEDLDLYVMWTKVYTRFPDLMARFVKGWITEEELKAELIDLGMPEERAQEMIETKVKKAKTDMPEAEESRDFTRSEILDGYRRGLFAEEETRTMLTALNYSAEQIDFYIRREDLKKEQDLREAYVKRYENLYVEGMITWADAAEALSIVGLMEAEIRELEPLWEMKRMVRIAHPSRADLDRFLKKGIIDDSTYRDEMRKMGYSDLYITWYLWSLLLEEAS